jgi:D-alanine-D-alanine ligase
VKKKEKSRNPAGRTGAAARTATGKEVKKLRVALLFGGRSGEHEVSLRSGASVLHALDPGKYEVVPVGITREGRWVAGPALALGGDEPSLDRVLESGRAVTASVAPGGARLIPLDALKTGAAPAIDVVFPVLHGTYGEDGTVQGLLELANIPYVGAGVLASSVGMDKDVMKRLFRDAGLPVVDWVLVERHEWEARAAQVRRNVGRKIGYPLFVKPANLGSSVGITKVHKPAELGAAMDLAARYDRKMIV